MCNWFFGLKLILKLNLENEKKHSAEENKHLQEETERNNEELKEKYEKTLIEIRFLYDKEMNNLSSKIEYLEGELYNKKEISHSHDNSEWDVSNPDDSMVSQFSVKFSELNDKLFEIRNQSNNEIFTLRHKLEDSNQKTLKLEKLLIRSKNEISCAVLDKEKEIKILSFKLLEAEKK